MSDSRSGSPDLSPEAVLARATAARGDIFPEWRLLAHTSPKTYHLINETVSYLHQYHGQEGAADGLSASMRELIAIPALCAKHDLRHAPNHVRRAYRIGLTNRALFEGAAAYGAITGWTTIAGLSEAITLANSPDYPFGRLPPGGEPAALAPFPEQRMGRERAGAAAESLAETAEWRYCAALDPELARRAAAFVDHCLAADGERDTVLGPGPRELIAIAALCARGEADIAAQHMRRAYDYGMTRRHVLEAICCVIPMTGMVTAQLGFRAMQAADK